MLDLWRVASIEELVHTVERFWSARVPDGAWLQGRGYNEAALGERRSPTRDYYAIARRRASRSC